MTKYSQLSLAIWVGVYTIKSGFMRVRPISKQRLWAVTDSRAISIRLIKIYIDEAQVVLMSSRLEFTSNLESLANIVASFVLNPVDKIIIDKLLM